MKKNESKPKTTERKKKKAEKTPEELKYEADRERIQAALELRTLARRRFDYYLRLVHRGAWINTKMSSFLAREVQGFLENKDGKYPEKILVIQTPPQHGKSMTIAESLPSWVLGRFPMWRTILISYNDGIALRYGRKNRDKVEEFGKPLFGIEKGSVWTTEEFERENRWGRVISRGFGSGITGNPADLMIIDDPIKSQTEADSETTREKIWSEWQSTLKTRVQANGKIIVVMTPWHEEDLSQRILRYEPSVRLIRLPVEAEPTETDPDPMGRQPGEPLCPELGKNAAWLADEKASFLSDPTKGGLRTWTALYMCRPRVEGGNIIKREWWKKYNPEDFTKAKMPGRRFTIISVDAAFKGKDNNDFVSIQVWTKYWANYYLRYGVNRHLTFTQTVQEIMRIRMMFPETLYVVIEDKANGPAIIEVLSTQISGVLGINPKGGKEARVYAAQPFIECGNVFLPDGSAFAEEMVDQFCAFPAGKHDDMVDACTQAITFLSQHGGYALPEDGDEGGRLTEDETARLFDNSAYDVYGLTQWGIGV